MPEPAYEYTTMQPPQNTYPEDASRNNATESYGGGFEGLGVVD
jgi:hypothetical protein